MAEKTSKGGFGSMDDKQREIAEKARKAAQERGVTSEDVRERGQDIVGKGREKMEDIHQKRDERNL